MKHITFEEEQRLQRQQRQRQQRQRQQRQRLQQRDIRVQVRIEPAGNIGSRQVRLQQRQQHQEEKEQVRLFSKYKEEEERVVKRGLPRHIVQLVMEHSHDKSCMICLDDVTIENVFMTKCGHIMCKGCERKMYDNKNVSCPTCRREF
jgi:Zinc finger, C3HC4 type (RING finger)